jgi:hypothetical protein
VIVNEEYEYYFSTSDPDGDDIYYYVDWGDDSNSGWIGPYSSGHGITLSHSWTTLGSYEILAKAKDLYHSIGEWSYPFPVEVVDNYAPNIPEIQGPTSGSAGVEYLYTFVTIDEDGDDVFYYIDWGDGEVDEWLGPYGSGVSAGTSHLWEEQGTYTVRIKAKDSLDEESDWGYLEVQLPVNQQLKNYNLHQFFNRSINLQMNQKIYLR